VLLALKKIFTAHKYLSIYLSISILFNLLLVKIPLVKVFGFESAVLNSLLLVLLSGYYTISLFKKKDQSLENRNLALASIKISSLLLIIIFPIISVTNSLLTIACSLVDGFLFYLIVTVPALVIGTTIGLFSVIYINKFPRTFFVILYLLILFIPLIEIYLNPQVYFYNPILVYFPGTIYDEALSVDFKLIEYRLFNLIYFGSALFFLYKLIFNQVLFYRRYLPFIFLLIASIFFYLSPLLGFSTSEDRLKNELGSSVTTKHFVIYYPGAIDDDLIKVVALHHEYYYTELQKFFNEEPKKKITSFIFNNRSEKKRLVGTANADVAKPWLNQTYTVAENYDVTLKHEIAHCFTGVFAEGIFKVAENFNPSLIEGAAMAADPLYDENYLDYMAALAYKFNFKINLKALFDYLNFFTNPSSVSYIYSGSFCKYLIDKFGIEKFKKFYNNMDFEGVYKIPLSEIEKEYFDFLTNNKLKYKQDEANYYFGRKSIFYKVCPRYVANKLESAWGYYLDGNYSKAENIFLDLQSLTNNYSALIGLANCQWELNDRLKAVDLLKNNLWQYKNSAYYYQIELELADFSTMLNQYASADNLYKKIIEQNPNRVLNYLAHTRKILLAKDTLLNSYLSGSDSSKYIILKELNSEQYYFSSVPILIDLSISINVQYDLFIKNFYRTIHVTDYASSNAMLKLSEYMTAHLDFNRARKMAALCLRYNQDEYFSKVLQANFDKTEWFYYNAEKNLNSFDFKKVE